MTAPSLYRARDIPAFIGAGFLVSVAMQVLSVAPARVSLSLWRYLGSPR
jgi:hypothetical protein